MNQKLLQQLALAKQAGTQSMAKDFFAKTPSPGTAPDAGGDAVAPAVTGGDAMTAGPSNDEAAGQTDTGSPGHGGAGGTGGAGGEQMTPEQLQELLHMLEQQQGGGQG